MSEVSCNPRLCAWGRVCLTACVCEHTDSQTEVSRNRRPCPGAMKALFLGDEAVQPREVGEVLLLASYDIAGAPKR